MLRFTLTSLFLLSLTLGCQPVTQDTRADTRAAISGRVVLVDENGLNDLSRVTVELGKGEGSTIPDEDGVFQLSDLEPDVYEVRIIYSGGLTADASESAYQEFNRRVLLQEGGAADIGDVVLELGLGTVSGQLTLEEGADPTAATIKLTRITDSDKAVRRIGEETYSQNVDDTGAFSVGDVQVGSYYVTVEGDGISATPEDGASDGIGEGVCLKFVQVAEHLELREAPSFNVKSTAVRFSAGTDQVIGPDTSSRWMLSGEGVTIHVQASFAEKQKMWLQGEEEPADYLPFEEAHVVDGLDEGKTEVYFRFQDPCEYDSEITTLTLVKDTEAPTIFAVRLNNDNPFALTPTVSFAIEATDANAAEMQMQLAVCTLSAAPDNHLQPAQELFVCDPALEDVPWVPYSPYASITFEGGDGVYGVLVRVRDAAENYDETPVAKAVTIDTQAPTGLTIAIDSEAGKINSPSAYVDISGDATDVAWMKVGLASGLSGVPWQVFGPRVAILFAEGDGEKTVFVRFKDAAGNESAEVQASAELVTTGTLTGSLVLEGGVDPSTAEVVLLGSSISTTPDVAGAWTLANAPAGTHILEVRTSTQTHVPVRLSVFIEVGISTELPLITLSQPRGQVSGLVTLEGSSDHSGISIELVGGPGTATTLTGSTGSFALENVLVGTYDVQISRSGFLGTTVTGIQVSSGEQAVVPSQELEIQRGGL